MIISTGLTCVVKVSVDIKDSKAEVRVEDPVTGAVQVVMEILRAPQLAWPPADEITKQCFKTFKNDQRPLGWRILNFILPELGVIRKADCVNWSGAVISNSYFNDPARRLPVHLEVDFRPMPSLASVIDIEKAGSGLEPAS